MSTTERSPGKLGKLAVLACGRHPGLFAHRLLPRRGSRPALGRGPGQGQGDLQEEVRELRREGEGRQAVTLKSSFLTGGNLVPRTPKETDHGLFPS